MQQVREVHCLVGAVDRTRFRETPLLGFGYAPDTLLDEFVKPSAVFRRGRFAMVPALDRRERMRVRFPPPVGALQVDTTLHSEVATLPLHFADRGVREVTFRQGFDAGFMERLEFLVKLGLADTEPLPAKRARGRSASRGGSPSRNGTGSGGVVPRSVLLALLARQPAATPIGPPRRHEVLRTVVVGRRGRVPVRVTCDCHAGPRAGGGIGPDIDTGAPPSIAVQLMLSGEIPIRPGVWAPETVVPVEPFVRELRRRGMRVTRRATRA
jgi:saccharopine dehydrogenase-like NADP-dependent oxidoreductase